MNNTTSDFQVKTLAHREHIKTREWSADTVECIRFIRGREHLEERVCTFQLYTHYLKPIQQVHKSEDYQLSRKED